MVFRTLAKLGVGLVLVPGIALAQVADPSSDPDLNAGMPRTSTPSADDPTPPDRPSESESGTVSQGENAGRSTIETHSSGTSHEESSSTSDPFDDRRDAGEDRRRRDDDGTGVDGDPRGPGGPAALFGKWAFGLQSGGSACQLELTDSAWSGGMYGMSKSGICPDGFFMAGRWRLAGTALQLLEVDGKVVGTLYRSGRSSWSGRRLSDGARIYISR